MRAQEVDLQRVVVTRDHAGRRLGVIADFTVAARRLRPRHVEEGAPRHRDEPTGRVGRRVFVPRGEGPDERLLDRVLGRREVRAATDEDAQHVRDKRTQLDVVHGHSVTVGGSPMNGRTSSHSWIGSPPAPGAAESSPASSIARS